MNSKNKFEHAKKTLPAEREKLLACYNNMLSVDMDSANDLSSYLREFAQLLTDYSAFGQFELVDCVVSRQQAVSEPNGQIQGLLNQLQQSTDSYLGFLERYQTTDQHHDLQELCEELETVGESLADRFEIEDSLGVWAVEIKI